MPPSYSWLKLYYEIIDDPKMGRLPDRLWRRVIECFLMAGKNGNSGTLPEVGAMAWALRTDEETLEKELSQILQIGILEQADGKWVVKNFEKRQAATPDAERMLQMRKRNRYEAVTPRNTEVEVEVEVDKSREEVEPEAAAAFRQVAKVYESEIGELTGMIADTLKDALRDYPPEWIAAALKASANANVRRWNYAEAILKRWKVDGFQSNKSKANGTNGHKPQTAQEIALEHLRKLEAQQNGK